MSFFKDFKDDFSDAVDNMSGDKAAAEKNDEGLTGTIDDSNIDVDSELSKLDGLLEKVSKKVDSDDDSSKSSDDSSVTAADLLSGSDNSKPTVSAADLLSGAVNATSGNDDELSGSDTADDRSASDISEQASTETTVTASTEAEDNRMDYTNDNKGADISDENAVITSGMTITGDLDSTGSISVQGTINGNVTCNGKLTVSGNITGNSQASEFFADSAHIQGEVVSNGTVKIGVGSVIIGNVTAASAVIAGAVKGDIDVQGPVVVDTSAVVMGDIKSKSVQINNGAIIDGRVSQTYADVDVSSVFGEVQG
ncbi:MAG: polymer-forming cytoskeletal protein [Lachnospiraceae bacterium]|nr:polymer-forming cytoskeletal protein [Lachnospiraceae bacterium]